MSMAVDNDVRRAQVSSAKKKLKQFRASRSGAVVVHAAPPLATAAPQTACTSAPPPLNTSAAENTMAAFTMPRRPSPNLKTSFDVLDEDLVKLNAPPTRAQRQHIRKNSRSHHRRDSSVASFTFPPPNQSLGMPMRPSPMGMFDLPPFDASEPLPALEDGDKNDPSSHSREIITTPATPIEHPAPLTAEVEEQVIARMSAFSFGAKPQGRLPLLPSLPLASSAQASSSRPNSLLARAPPFLPELASASMRDSLSAPRPTSRPSSPTRKKRHSHNRSESISLPNLKLGGRSASLGLPSPGFGSAPSSPFGEASSRSSRVGAPVNGGSRLKFEPSDKEKEESRRRALDKLTGGPRVEEQRHSITLPSFDDDDDSVSSSRPPSSGTLNSTASSSRPSSVTATSSGSCGGGSLTSPLPWSTFEDSDRWSFPHRFDPNKEELASFELPPAPSKTCSVLLNSGLGVLAEEDETESDEEQTDVPRSSTASAPEVTSPTTGEVPAAGPTPSRLRELHLVSSNSARRGSNPEVKESFTRAALQSRETPTKPSGSNNRRPRPLGLDEASVFIANSTPSPNRVGRSNSLNSSLGKGRRQPSSRGSSISYKKDDSGSSHDFSIGGVGSPPAALSDVSSPTYSLSSPPQDLQSIPRALTRQSCPRPRSMILMGAKSRVLGEVDEEEEDATLGFREDGVSHGRPSFESSRDSLDSSAWAHRRDSRDRIDAEMERDALREDVDLWRKRCRGLEDQLESERRETSRLRERVRKLGDRILQQSAAHAAAPCANEEREIAQSRLIAEMRDQLFSLASALERERSEKANALSHAAELQAMVDLAARTPHVTAEELPTTPKGRPRSVVHPIEPAQYDDAESGNFEDADNESLQPTSSNDDPNLNRMRGFSFPHGPVDAGSKANKRDSFFGLSRARPVRAPKASGSGLGLAWPHANDEAGHHDLPPIVIDDSNASFITPVSPRGVSSHNTTISTNRVVSEPTRKQLTHDAERTLPSSTSMGGFGLSFLSGYLPLPRAAAPPPPPQGPIPRISITPSSISPKKTLMHLERDRFNARIGSVAHGCEVDFRHCCNGCSGDVIEL